MNTKSNFKILLLVAILLISMCLFNTNMVQATGVTQNEATSTAVTIDENTLNSIGDTITVDLKEVEGENYEKFVSAVKTKVESLLKSAEIELGTDYYIEVNYGSDIYEAYVDLIRSADDEYIASKEFTIKYSNSSNRNDTDKNYVTNVANKLDEKIYRLFELGTEIDYLDENSLQTFIVNTINDKSVQVFVEGAGGDSDGSWMAIYDADVKLYKNDVYYLTKRIKIYEGYGFTLTNGTPITMMTIGKTDSVYKEMAKKLKGEGLTNIIGCYELTSHGDTTKNMSVTFTLGSKYNGKEVKILHKMKNNKYETLTATVKDGKATITVDELSPFMIALNTTTTTNRVLDNEPKTRYCKLYSICKCNCSCFIRWNSNIKI